MFEVLFFSLSILALGICAWTDWRKHKIYNKITLPLITLGLALQFLNAMTNNNSLLFIVPLASSLTVLSFTYWLSNKQLLSQNILRAGDIKLMIGITLLNPINYGLLIPLVDNGTRWVETLSYSYPIFIIELFLLAFMFLFPMSMLILLVSTFKKQGLKNKGIAFAPALFLAYLFLQLFGDVIWNLRFWII